MVAIKKVRAGSMYNNRLQQRTTATYIRRPDYSETTLFDCSDALAADETFERKTSYKCRNLGASHGNTPGPQSQSIRQNSKTTVKQGSPSSRREILKSTAKQQSETSGGYTRSWGRPGGNPPSRKWSLSSVTRSTASRSFTSKTAKQGSPTGNSGTIRKDHDNDETGGARQRTNQGNALVHLSLPVPLNGCTATQTGDNCARRLQVGTRANICVFILHVIYIYFSSSNKCLL